MSILTIATIVTVILQLFNMWLLSKRVIAYHLMLVVYAGYMGIETHLALSSPSQWSIMLFNLVNVWAVAMAIKGAREDGWVAEAPKKGPIV